MKNEAGLAGSASGVRRACFLDRDGTLIREEGWVTQPREVELLPGAARALRRLNQAGWTTVLTTNQSAVARGLLDLSGLARVHERLRELLAREGAQLDALYVCPHHPDQGLGELRRACECRKPEPGLILRAARELGLDLAASAALGDAERDLEAARRAGVGRAILVLTGKGREELARLSAAGRAPESARDLSEAVERLLGATAGRPDARQ